MLLKLFLLAEQSVPVPLFGVNKYALQYMYTRNMYMYRDLPCGCGISISNLLILNNLQINYFNPITRSMYNCTSKSWCAELILLKIEHETFVHAAIVLTSKRFGNFCYSRSYLVWRRLVSCCTPVARRALKTAKIQTLKLIHDGLAQVRSVLLIANGWSLRNWITHHRSKYYWSRSRNNAINHERRWF